MKGIKRQGYILTAEMSLRGGIATKQSPALIPWTDKEREETHKQHDQDKVIKGFIFHKFIRSSQFGSDSIPEDFLRNNPLEPFSLFPPWNGI